MEQQIAQGIKPVLGAVRGRTAVGLESAILVFGGLEMGQQFGTRAE
jgi:hypothetical protein